MINPKALETFGNYDKKSLMAGITVGQGLKGRARAPQTPAPAGFPQDLWDAASQRANAMIAQLQAEESGETPSEPETPEGWTFDKDAFCFGVAAGRVLEGWEIDGGLNLTGSLIMYYLHIDSFIREILSTYYFDYVQVSFFANYKRKFFIDWGDGYVSRVYTGLRHRHSYQTPGDYVVIVYSDISITPEYNYVINLKRGGVSAHFSASNTGYIEDSDVLRSVYLAGNIPRISQYAYLSCHKLASVTIPDSVTNIEQYAFCGCNALTSVTIPDNVTFIGNYAFEHCISLTSVTIGRGITSISDRLFWMCHNLTSVTIPDGVTSIGEGAFTACEALESVTIPASVTSIGSYAFRETGLTSVTINRNATVGENAFPDNCTINYY